MNAERICALPECNEPVPDKPPSQPGPQPKFCGRDCQTIAAHRARKARVRSALSDSERLAAVEAELDELREMVGRIDWARVPPSALRVPDARMGP